MAKPVRITFEVEDSEGKESTVPTYWLASTVDTLAKAIQAANAYSVLLKATTDCGINGASVSFPITLSTAGLDTVTPPTYVSQGANLSFENENEGAFTFYIPGIKPALISGGAVVNEAGNPIADIIAVMIGGVSGLMPADNNGLDITSFRKGQQTTRKK